MRRWMIGSTVWGLMASAACWGGFAPAPLAAAPNIDEIEAPVPSDDGGTGIKPQPSLAPPSQPELAPPSSAPPSSAPLSSAEPSPLAPAEAAPMTAETPAPSGEAPARETAPATPEFQSRETELPGLAIATILPGQTQLGIPFTATLKITNRGGSAAELVTMVLPIPSQVELLEANPKPESFQQGTLRFSLGELPAGGEKSVQVKLTPKIGGPIALKARLASIASAPIEVDVRQAKLEVQLQGAPRIAFGENTEWKLIVANRGNGDADQVTCAFQYPNEAIEIRTREPVRELGSLKAGAQREISIRLTGRRSGKHPIEIAVGSKFAAIAKASQAIEVGLPSVQVSANGPESISLGKQAIYSIGLVNPSDRPLEQVQVVAHLPPGLKVVAIDRDAVLDDLKGQLYWQLGRLAANGKESLNLKVEATQPGNQSMQVAVRAGAGPTAQASHAAEVIARADLRMIIAGTTDSVALGGVAEMTVVVQNTGSRDANQVQIRLQLPPGVEAQDGIDYTIAGDTVTYAPTTVRASQKLVLKCQVVGKATGDQVVRATLQAEGLPQLTSEDSVHFHEARNPQAAPRR